MCLHTTTNTVPELESIQRAQTSANPTNPYLVMVKNPLKFILDPDTDPGQHQNDTQLVSTSRSTYPQLFLAEVIVMIIII